MTNDACRGYVILAMRELGYKGEDIEKVVDELHYTFDTVAESQAEQVYNDPFKYEKKSIRDQIEKSEEKNEDER